MKKSITLILLLCVLSVSFGVCGQPILAEGSGSNTSNTPPVSPVPENNGPAISDSTLFTIFAGMAIIYKLATAGT